jgi:hypothetical protein
MHAWQHGSLLIDVVLLDSCPVFLNDSHRARLLHDWSGYRAGRFLSSDDAWPPFPLRPANAWSFITGFSLCKQFQTQRLRNYQQGSWKFININELTKIIVQRKRQIVVFVLEIKLRSTTSALMHTDIATA